MLVRALTDQAAAWVVHVASLTKRSKGATQSIGSTVIDGILLDEIQTEQIVELGPQLVAMKAWDVLGFTPMLHHLGMNATAQLMVANRKIARKGISSSACWPIISCVGWGIGSGKAATCGTGKPCAGCCAPTRW